MALFVSSQLNHFAKLFSLYFIVLIPSFAAVLISTELNWSLACNFIESVLFGVLIVLVISFFKKSTFKRILNYILFSHCIALPIATADNSPPNQTSIETDEDIDC